MGSIKMVPGGALRNTAEAIGRLGWTKPTFVSAVGDDDMSNVIRRSLEEAGVSAEGLYVNKDLPTAAYNGILNEKGDMFCGVSDMKVLEDIPKSHLDKFHFWDSQILLIDGNVGYATLEYLLGRSSKVRHVIYDPISQAKCGRIMEGDFLTRLTCFKPNITQLRHLCKQLST